MCFLKTNGSNDIINDANGDNINIILTDENADIKYYELGNDIIVEIVIDDVKSKLTIKEWQSDYNPQIPNQITIQEIDGTETVLSSNDIDNIKQRYPKVIINGTEGDDYLGAEGDNIIYAGEGNDFIDDWVGNDEIYAGSGDDYVEDWDGDNIIYTEEGNDSVNSGSGNDYIDGGSGDDNIRSGSGNDTILGGSGNDTIDSGSGDNIITTGSNQDYDYF